MATNLEAPLFLTQALIPHLKRCLAEEGATKPRVLHVSSGAAETEFEGLGAYCISKAGLKMMYKVLAAELLRNNIAVVGSVRPGVVDTPMQNTARESDFPFMKYFRDLHANGELDSPNNVAKYFHWLLTEVDDEEFSKDEWDFYLPTFKEDIRWKEYRSSE